MKWVKMSFEEIAKTTMVKWMSGKVKNARMMKWKENGLRMMWDEWQMNMRGDERDADEMMREDMKCGQNEQMNSKREETVRMVM